MTGNKRYTYNPYELWIIDNKGGKEYYSIEEVVGLLNEKEERIRELEKENEHLKYINNIYNDLGILPFSSAKAICDELNKQDKRIKKLEEKNASMKGRVINAIVKSNQVECNCSPCVCEKYVNEELKKW